MEKCPSCKERPANFLFRNGANSYVNWCLECASTKGSIFKLKEVLPPEPTDNKTTVLFYNGTNYKSDEPPMTKFHSLFQEIMESYFRLSEINKKMLERSK